ncbi:MAG: hypothetical protein JW973_02075 [Bacteroidales bacterium]|nr:hypothetical protein [Bacteroidales bacterium]
MTNINLMLGQNPVRKTERKVKGQLVTINGEEFYEIRNYDSMLPFLMSLVSDSNHWMFISSTGGLSAGRINPDNALFPYYTDDKIHDTADITGSKTIFHVRGKNKVFLWEPFSERNHGIYDIKRNVFKSTTGNKVIFEEINTDLGLSFRYGWMNSDKFGWIKKSSLINTSEKAVEIIIIDGIQNIMPYGITPFMQNQFSTLLDGYKKCELLKKPDIGIFRLESIPVDKAEPSEALQVTTVWSYGLERPVYLLSSRQLEGFRRGAAIHGEEEAKGMKGAFFVNCKMRLAKKEKRDWYVVAEVNQDSVRVNNLIDFLENSEDIAGILEDDISAGTKNLRSIVEEADGIQHTADKLITSRHFSNVLFNVMRGGIFSEGYTIQKADLINHVKKFNFRVWKKHNRFLNSLPAVLKYEDLEDRISRQNDEDLYRLFLEYLPLTFSRRHGDPSRPWNLFSINVRDAAGNKILYYQGNWRDIFQNWEALSLSYPLFVNGMIAKFVNASSADGYNPYRITRDGIDWEEPDPENPWSNIGYWGDHQIVYLLRLMEVSQRFMPGLLNSWLNKCLFVYSNIPYRIKTYGEIVKNPHDSITFNRELNEEIKKHVKQTGTDGKLLHDSSGEVMKVNFTEKLLAPLLSKLSNLIPEAGIWMNTLRPEWNDANNALVGYGVSMVTLCYIRRFISFINGLFQTARDHNYNVSQEMADFLYQVDAIFRKNSDMLKQGFDDAGRKRVTDQLGIAGSEYRDKIYKGFSGKKMKITAEALVSFFNLALRFIDQSIDANKRSDKLYNAYNLITFDGDKLRLRYLYEMLEGQVAVLSSGRLSVDEVIEILDTMRKSALYRPDQDSYLLYPDKRLPWYLEKNNIPADDVKKSHLLSELIRIGDTSVIARDRKGKYHFHGTFSNAGYLKKALFKLKETSVIHVTDEEVEMVLGIYEKVFDHQSFTGRSGTFYKYEGLGSIYWHMVAKLLVAIGENIARAMDDNASRGKINRLVRHYIEVKKGIGAHKPPDRYGAFPFEPYSHTPSMAGVQQPGMTGQVKEDIISRFFELGLSVRDGQIQIRPVVLKKDEFIIKSEFTTVPHLTYTFCRVRFVYLLDKEQGIEIETETGKNKTMDDYMLSRKDTRSIISRDGRIRRVVVHLDDGMLV